MIHELAKYEEFWARKSMVSSTGDYRNNMEELAKDQTKSIDNVHHAIETQTFALVASQAALAGTMKQGFNQINDTMNQGFNQVNNTLEAGFSGISNQLGYMTAATNMGFLNLEDAIERMNAQICDKLDALYNATIRPLLVKTREYYHLAAEAYKGGHFDDALDYIKKALDEYKTDYISWFLEGKIYAFGASKHSNVIDLDKAIDAFQNAAKYNEQYISKSDDAQRMAAEIYFNLGIAQFSKSNDLLRENKKAESDAMLAQANSSFEQSYKYSNNMLESLYNLARCKVLQGEYDSAIKDLNTLVVKDRDYCLKVYANQDFSSIKEQFDNLIKGLKNNLFTSAKNDYDRINTMRSELNSLGGYTNEKVPSGFSETLPYFDILDYANDFKRIIPIVEKALTDKKAAIAEAKRKESDARVKAEIEARKAKKEEAERERWAQQEREREEERKEERKKARRNSILLGTVIGLAAGAGIALCLTILLPIVVQFITDSDSDFVYPIVLIIILIPSIVVTVKIKGNFWVFVYICVPWVFGVAAYCMYAAPFLLKASNSLIALIVGAAAIVGAGVGALIGAKKKKK